MAKLKRFSILAIAILLCFKFIVAQEQTGSAGKGTVKTILFVGNSLTYANNLPGLVEQLGKDRDLNIKSEMLAKANYALEDHWNDGILQEMLATKKYDYVVIQQGPSSQEEGRQMLLDYGARIKALCDSQHARLAFFMVWPAYSNFQNFDGVIKNYTEAAMKTNSLLCPVGKTWKKYFLETGDYSYYGADQFHPSLKGSEAAARIIYETLFKE